MKNKIITSLKVAIIIALGLIIFGIISFAKSSYADSYWGTRKELVNYVKNNSSKILDGGSKDLLGIKLSCNDGGDYIAVNSACFAHWKSNGSNSAFRVKQVISWRYENGTYYAYNYLYGATDSNSPYDLTDGSNVSKSLIKLAGAIEYQLNTRKTNTGYAYGYSPIGSYFKQAVNNGLATVNALSSSTGYSSSSSDGASSYLSTVTNFKKIKVDDSDATASISGNNIIIGPITLTFSGSIKSISVDGYTGTVYWATSSNSDSWSKKASEITSNKKIYIKLNKNKITASKTYNITFVQNTGIYNCELLIAASTTNGAQQFGTYAVSSSPYTEEATAEIPASYNINIEIEKVDADSGNGIEGIGFTIYDKTEGKYIDENGEYQSKEKNAYVYTDSDGKISITDISVSYGTHEIVVTEAKSKNEYYTVVDTITDTKEITEEGTLEYKFENEPLEVTVSKIDTSTGTTLQGIGFKFKLSDGTWISGNGSGSVSYVSSSSKADEYVTGEDGTVTIVGLKKGTYTVYETSVDSTYAPGYYLEDQEGYDSENGWVVCGTVEVDDSGEITFSIEYENVKRLQLSGYVWVDEPLNKDDDYNNVMDDVETRVEGVTVYLYNKNDTKNYAAKTTTDSNGYYIFGYECYNNSSYTGEKLTYENKGDFYVEFDYSTLEIKETHEDDSETLSGTEFIPVAFNSENADSIVDNGSRALMDDVAYEDENLTGIATTYTGIENEAVYGLSGNLFDKLYDADSNTLEWINLGIFPIYDPDYEIKENLAYVKIVVNGYEYMYEYGYTETVGNDDEVTVPTVSFQDGSDITLYTRYMYPSDLAQAILTDGESLQVYVVYAITIKNTETYSVENRYVEQNLYITSLTNTFDTTRYKLNTEANTGGDNGDAMNDTEEAANDDFGSWGSSVANDGENTSTTTYQGDQIVIGADQSETVYIQFEVTLEGITEILANPDGVKEENPTEASTDGYHIYKRNDYSWTNGIYKEEVDHRTSSKTKTSSAPYLVFKLPDEDEDDPEETSTTYLNREISGVVFEDTDATSGDDEALGDGQYDSESESVVANVTVDLLDSDGNEVYKYAVYKDGEYYLYDGENYYRYDESSGEYVKITDDNFSIESTLITATTDDSGSYTLSGMVPGEYTLKFTYYDENNTNLQTTINGNTISINDYKSTVVKSSAARNALGYDTNSYDGEWYKYLEGDNYSVATDDLEQREDYNEEYYEALYDDEKSVTTTIMEASTATFDITVEDTTDTSHLGYTTIYYEDSEGNSITEEETQNLTNYTMYTDSFFAYEYTGFNFGIIVQPIQSLEIDKVITNVKLVNDPTILFDGNPQTDDLDGVSDLDGNDTNNASTYTRIEVEENEMYGSTFTVTYEITITNTSQINYYETEEAYYGWYYMFGETVDCSEIVYIDIETLLDYLDYDLTLSGSMYETATAVDETTTTNELDSTNVEKTSITTERQNDEIDVNKYTITELTPVAREEEGSSDVVKLTATKVLSTSEDDMAYSNVAEIIQARNSDKDGSEDDNIPTSIKLVKAPILPEESEAYVTISPPTGGDASTILIYVIAGLGMLMVLSIGIVITKKKIL